MDGVCQSCGHTRKKLYLSQCNYNALFLCKSCLIRGAVAWQRYSTDHKERQERFVAEGRYDNRIAAGNARLEQYRRDSG